LRELNLDVNLISDGGSIPYLPALTVLRLNHNLITMITPPPSNGPRMGVAALAALEVLQLGFNQIVDILSLSLRMLPNLKVLHLQGNEIVRVEGLNEMHQLRELNLDRNKIKALDARSLASLSSLRELRIEENGLRTLDHFVGLPQLTTLAASSNRITEVYELDKLESMPHLQHLTLANNAVARKQLYRPALVRRLPSLRLIDAREVTLEERERVEVIFNADARASQANAVDPTVLRGLTTKVPLKVTSLNFELVAGLGGGLGPATDTRIALPPGATSTRLDRNLHGDSGQTEWHPLLGGHDGFFQHSQRSKGSGRFSNGGRGIGGPADRRPPPHR
jgi:hypothetical protein